MYDDPNYSEELQILMGEWLAFAAISKYHFHMSRTGDSPKGLSDSEMFESYPIYSESHTIYGDATHFLGAVGIVRSDKHYDYANCKYREIPLLIRANIKNLRWQVPFISVADYIGYFGSSERDYFYVDEKCNPLINRLIVEGLCRRLDNRYFWTRKFRPLLESNGVWASAEQEKNENYAREQFLESMSKDLKKRLNYLAATDQLIMAVKTLSDETELSFSEAQPLLREYMFPKIWSRPKKNADIIFKWFGPV